MKAQFLKWASIGLVVLLSVDSLCAQTKPRPVKRRPAATNSAYPNSGYNTQQPKDTTTNPAANNNTQSAYTNPAANSGAMYIDTTLPMTVITGGNGLLDSLKPSLRNDASIEQNLVKDRVPLPYENLREDDAVYRVRVWRTIDAREKMNLAFRYAAEEDNGSQRFISILLRAIKDDGVTAFNGSDDRFTTPITAEAAMNSFGKGNDTSKKYDRDGNVVGYEVRPKAIDPDSIYQFGIKEEWVFDKESSRLFVRILGIAPIIPFYRSDGVKIDNSEHPAFWVYYPDLRASLSKCDVYNGKNYGARMTWEELFEGRMFSSYITKSTLDNPYDLTLSQVYPNNTLFRLLAGENIKDKIFNYEQSQWQY